MITGVTGAFWTLYVFTFVMTIEFGQTAAEIVRRATKEGLKSALLVASGAALAEVVFLVLTATGLIFFLSDVSILPYVWLLGGTIILYLGVRGIMSHRSAAGSPTVEVSRASPFMSGFLLNFAHPMNVVWWSGTLGPIVLQSIHDNGYQQALIDGLGVPVGAFTWWVILAYIASFMKRSFSPNVIQKINLGSSIGLMAFGLYFISRAIQLFFV